VKRLLSGLAEEMRADGSRILLRNLLPIAIQLLILVSLYLLTGSPTFLFVSIGISIGWAVGSTLSYRWGMKDRAEILDDSYGADWNDVLARRRAEQIFEDRREAAPYN
jgi:predicted exporter